MEEERQREPRQDRVAVIVNPHSASGGTGRAWGTIRFRLEQTCGPLTVLETQAAGHAIELTADAIRSGHRQIIAVGGDGTLNEVVNGVMSVEGAHRDTLVGLLPRGTGSDFRRTIQMPLNAEDAIETLGRGKTAAIDVMRVVYQRSDGTEGIRHAINVTSFGIGGRVAERVNRSSKPLGGSISFLTATAMTAFAFRGDHISLELDDEAWPDLWITNVAVGNGQFHGAGMWICPRARLDDALLDVTIVERMSLWEIFRNISILFNGRLYDHDKVHFRRVSEVHASSKNAAAIEIDGEPLGRLPLEITVLPKAVQMIVP